MDALTTTLYALGDLTLTDVEAVGLGHTALATELRRASDSPERHLSADATYFYERLLTATCLHIVHFFTQRSTFVAATLVAQSRRQGELIAKVDALIARSPLPGAEDVAFEGRYLAHMAKKHSKLTIFGIDLSNSPGKWPLDAAYLSLEAAGSAEAATGLPHTAHLAHTARESFPEERATRPPAGPAHRPAFESRPADQALSGHERVLLRGEAGSGKTTLVQWLAVSAARRDGAGRMAYLHDRIPFVLPLRTLTRHGERLPAPKDFLAAVGSPLAGEQPAGWESRVLTRGRALVLVDGIDEIPEAERFRTRAWLSDLIDTYPGNRWLVTARPSAVREDWLADEGFTELTLSSMSPADVAAFVKRWHAAARTGPDDENTENATLASYERQLLAAVRAKPDLGRLATNPLMCALICALHRDRRGFLPLGRKDLYTAALSMLLVRRDRERDMGGVPELREEPQVQLLQRLAYWLIRNGRTEMDRSRAESIIADTLPAVPEVAALGDAKAVFDHFLHRSGLLRQPGPATVEFIHRTFQDFLGARASVDEGDFGVLTGHAADDQWEDVIRMAVAHARPRERAEFFTGLLAHGDAHTDAAVRTRLHLLAAACLEHAAELSPAVREEIEHRAAALVPPADAQAARELAAAGPMILDLLPGPEELDDETATLVVIAASHLATEAAIPFLARFCAHPAILVRKQLAWSWGRFDTRQYADEVIAHLDPTDLYFSVTSDKQLTALRELGGRPWIDVRGDLSPPALHAYALTTALSRVRIRENASLTDVSFLRGQTGLTDLDISDCPLLADLSGLDGLPLTALRLESAAYPDLSVLSSMDELRILGLAGEDRALSLEAVPAPASLTDLSLAGMKRLGAGLCGLSRFSGLQALSLGPVSSPQDAADWEEISRLPGLSFLSVDPGSLDLAPRSLTVRPVRILSMHGVNSQSGVDRCAQLFPRVRRLHIWAPASDLDLTPLAALADLEVVRFAQGIGTVRGIDRLPGTVTVAGLDPTSASTD